MMGRIIRRELRLAARHQAELLNPLWFFLVVDCPVRAWRRPGAATARAHRARRGVGGGAARSLLADGSAVSRRARGWRAGTAHAAANAAAVVVIAKVTAHWVATGLRWSCFRRWRRC